MEQGANIDTRTKEEAAIQDITAGETISQSVDAEFKEIDPKDIRTFGNQDQGSKCDCVAETRRKLKRIMMKVNKGLDLDFSSVALYKRRSNYPGTGMIAADAIAIDALYGMTLDLLVPSDLIKTETEANALEIDDINEGVGKAFAIQSTDIIFTAGDFDKIAGTIQKTRKGVMVWFYATKEEWSKEVPTLDTELTGPSDSRAIRHSVTAIEPALYNGVKGIWIDDSAPFGGYYRRFITEEFFTKRNWYASYPIGFKYIESPSEKPSYTFNKDLEFSSTYFVDSDVVALQDILKYEGFFPTNVASTGYFGALTLQAVKRLHVAYGIAGTTNSGYGRVGPKTRAYLNATYGSNN